MDLYILKYEPESFEEDAILSCSSSYVDRIMGGLNYGEIWPIEDILEPINIEVDLTSSRGKMTDALYLDGLEVLVVSRRFIDRFQSIILKKVQYLQIILQDRYSNAEKVFLAKIKGEKIEYKEKKYVKYSIVNFIGLLDCVDHTASDLEYYTPRLEIPDDMPEDMKKIMLEEYEEDNDIDFIRKLVLDESKIPDDIHIFRLKDCPRILIFKEHIVKAIREEGLTGFVFVPLEEYTDEIPDDDDNDDQDEAEAKEEAAQERAEASSQAKQEQPDKPEHEEAKPGNGSQPASGIRIKGIKKNQRYTP